MKNNHGGRREGAGRPPKPPEARAPRRPMFPLRVPPDLHVAYRAADRATQARAREAMIAALRETLAS